MFFMIAFRTSIGDYSFDDFSTADFYEIGLVVWSFIMIVGNMVFMNFIIAVVNQSYEQCMSKMVVLQFKVKLDMIVEREEERALKNRLVPKLHYSSQESK
jgi:hypothetical protein